MLRHVSGNSVSKNLKEIIRKIYKDVGTRCPLLWSAIYNGEKMLLNIQNIYVFKKKFPAKILQFIDIGIYNFEDTLYPL